MHETRSSLKRTVLNDVGKHIIEKEMFSVEQSV